VSAYCFCERHAEFISASYKKSRFRNKFEMTVSQLICETDLGSSVGLCKLASLKNKIQ